MRFYLVVATLLSASCDAQSFWGQNFSEEKPVAVATCKRSADCPAQTPVCLGGGTCAKCTEMATECATRAKDKGDNLSFCAADTGLCSQCNVASDCMGDTLSCKAHACVDTCQAHADCKSAVCDPYAKAGGRCLAVSEVIYVDNKNGACTVAPAGNDGSTPEKALCVVAEALAKIALGRTSIRLLPSTGNYGPIVLQTGTVAIYGPAGEGGKKATVGGIDARDSIEVKGGADATIDGVEVSGGSNGVSCTASRLRLRRSVIVAAKAVGVLANDCGVVALDRDQITDARAGGLNLNNVADYAVTNQLIVKNTTGMDVPTVSILGTSGSTRGLFRFNTIADNAAGNLTSSGIFCSPPRQIEDTIIFGNSKPAGMSQIAGSCRLANTVVGKGDTFAPGDSNVIREDVEFVLQLSNYQLKPSATCCVDRAGRSPGVDWDYEGTPRPQGNGPDIGAYEQH